MKASGPLSIFYHLCSLSQCPIRASGHVTGTPPYVKGLPTSRRQSLVRLRRTRRWSRPIANGR